MTRQYYAHSCKGAPPSTWQLLREHLCNVATLAQSFAQNVRPNEPSFADAAFWAGLFHDVGKYRDEFQRLLSGGPKTEETRHKQAGAACAVAAQRLDLAFAIAGHHGGIPDADGLNGLKELVHGRGKGKAVFQQIEAVAVADCPELRRAPSSWAGNADLQQLDVVTRFLFSCLVDADWRDTGDFFRRVRGLPPLPEASLFQPDEWLACVLAYIEERAKECDDGVVKSLRREILNQSLVAAEHQPGLFSLAVPTGGGKTLASLAFALKHAAVHGLRRLIYVAPYLTIIEQNAREFRLALKANGDDLVFEHHSLSEGAAGDDENQQEAEDRQRRAENWDAPIIVTTNVQFFESLFSNQPGRCRKLHNIARSVVVLDECQTLSPSLVAPTCSMLGQLCEWAGCSIVLCTATQPAWEKRANFSAGLSGLRAIAPSTMNLFPRLRRTEVEWPAPSDSPWDFSQLADRVVACEAALCIVNTKLVALRLFQELRQRGCKKLFHLSTNMCPAHRLEVLDTVRDYLKKHRPCLVVSTQLVEAGVDLDFPRVFRQLAPLEAIVQAAGRCNREGRLNGEDGKPGGKVIVFRTPAAEAPNDSWYRAGIQVVETLLRAGRCPDIHNPAHLDEYFRRLYNEGGQENDAGLDAKRIQQLRGRNFATIWRGHPHQANLGRYRIVEDDTTPVVATRWKRRQTEIEALLEQFRRAPSRTLRRRLSRFEVNLPSYELQQSPELIVEEPWGVKTWCGEYDERTGLSFTFAAENLVS